MKRVFSLLVCLCWLAACSSHPSVQTPRVEMQVGGQTSTVPTSTSVSTSQPITAGEVIPASEELRVNQVGYLPTASKIGFATLEVSQPMDWYLLDDQGNVVDNGQTSIKGFDPVSGDFLQTIDFTSYSTPGEGYRIEVDGRLSFPFAISDTLYAAIKKDALEYFYRSRSGIPIMAEYAGSDWARPAGHLSDSRVTCWKGTDADGVKWPGCSYTLNAAGGWYDAGDYGKYVVNGGIAVWTLMNLYEQMPEAFPDGSLSIPENANGVPDLLDEARWEMEFLLSMQVPQGQPQAGMVHHKLHDIAWSGLGSLPPAEADQRFLYAPSTAATLNLAATGAQCARLWQSIDAVFSQKCLQSAETAWQAAMQNPAIYAGNNPGTGGGNYDDTEVSDEFYWAAADLYITTAKDEYRSFLLSSPFFGTAQSFDWQGTATLGTLSLASTANGLSEESGRMVRNSILVYANELLDRQSQDGYSVLINGSYPWGSNGLILNNMMVVAEAYKISGEPQYLDAIRESMSYILGRNPVNISYVSGYGSQSMQHPHHRFWYNDPARGFPAPPPGVLSGGPNANPSDDTAKSLNLGALPESRRYVDESGSYSTNEVAINWNAPLVWMSAFLDSNR